MKTFYYYHFCLIFIIIHGNIQQIDVQQDKRVQFECILKSKSDIDGTLWMRIRPPHNPDILTYRDNIVYASDRFILDQRHITSNINSNGTFQDTFFLTLIILQVNLNDQGRYICIKGRTIFAEYDLFIIVPPRFIEETLIPQQTVIEGSTLDLFCSAEGQPMPWITWFYRTTNNKLIRLGDDIPCRDRLCHLHLPNYTRHDPNIIECIAENEKSNRISKIFQIDVFYPPKIQTNIQTLTKSKSIDVIIECSSIGNPRPTISWFDENQQEILDSSLYTIKRNNSYSILSFIVYSKEHSKVLYYCRSNNSLGIIEKLIDISDFIQFDKYINQIPIRTVSSTRKRKLIKTTQATIITTISSISTRKLFSNVLFYIYSIILFFKFFLI